MKAVFTVAFCQLAGVICLATLEILSTLWEFI